MSPTSLVDDLLALPDIDIQKDFLSANIAKIDDEFASTLREKADEFLRGNVQRTLDISQLFYHMAPLTNNPFYQALGLFYEANAYALGGLGDYPLALERCDEAVEIYRQEQDEVLEADAQITRIYVLSVLGRSQEALAAGSQARKVLETRGTWAQLVNLLINIAIVHSRLSEDSEALVLYEEAKRYCQDKATDDQWYLLVLS